ncbi:hypothetical protein HDU97_006424 [Phlyctochytrium planicorne]|nr:hypothetical protein HDU97_006424 [Phlyctochytrium planicorne]
MLPFNVTGMFPYYLGDMPRLQSFDVTDNMFHGPIPLWAKREDFNATLQGNCFTYADLADFMDRPGNWTQRPLESCMVSNQSTARVLDFDPIIPEPTTALTATTQETSHPKPSSRSWHLPQEFKMLVAIMIPLSIIIIAMGLSIIILFCLRRRGALPEDDLKRKKKFRRHGKDVERDGDPLHQTRSFREATATATAGNFRVARQPSNHLQTQASKGKLVVNEADGITFDESGDLVTSTSMTSIATNGTASTISSSGDLLNSMRSSPSQPFLVAKATSSKPALTI